MNSSMNNPMRRLTSLKVSDVMAHKVVTVSPRQPMADVATLFANHEISSAPVIDQRGICVGVLSAFDFVIRDARKTNQAGLAAQRPTDSPAPETVESYMSPKVKFIKGEAPLLQVANAMCTQHVHRLPVVDRDGKPIGVVSTMDIVAAMLNAIDEAQQPVSGPG